MVRRSHDICEGDFTIPDAVRGIQLTMSMISACPSGRDILHYGYAVHKMLYPPSVPSNFPSAVAQMGPIGPWTFCCRILSGTGTCRYLPMYSHRFSVGSEPKEVLHQLSRVDQSGRYSHYSHGRGYTSSSLAIAVEIEPVGHQEEATYRYVLDWWNVS